jgi:hypothetical protein
MMASASVGFEDKWDDVSNLLPWKVRITPLLEENDFWILSRIICLSSQKEGGEGHTDDYGCRIT